MRLINRKKLNLFSYVQESHKHERFRDRSTKAGKMSYICHPVLRKEIGAWDLQGRKSHSQDEKSNSIRFIIRCFDQFSHSDVYPDI